MKVDDIIQSIESPSVKARVNWCVEGTAGITYLEPPDYKGGHNEISIANGWIVVYDAPPKPTSLAQKASEMSVEELRANIENLRAMRSRPLKIKGESRVRNIPSDPLSKVLNSLSPEQLAKIKEKLGLK